MAPKTNLRWSENDVLLFLNTIIEEIDGQPEKFEKPTALIFYEKIRTKQAELSRMSHQNMKNKFNYLKAAYMKAINWRNSTGSGVLQEGETVEDRLNFMCKHFDLIDQILAGKRNVNLPYIVDTLDHVSTNEEHRNDIGLSDAESLNQGNIIIVEEYLDNQGDDAAVENLIEVDGDVGNEQEGTVDTGRVQSEPRPKKRKSSHSGPVNALIEMQEKRVEAENIRSEKQIEIDKEKIAIEREKMDIEKKRDEIKIEMERKMMEIEERKMVLEEKRVDEELKVKKYEIDTNAEIAKFKIQSEERMKRYELELKFKDRS